MAMSLPRRSRISLLLIPSFVIYVITMFGESNRLPFDLPECESELVSGYITEYSGFPYGMYFLAEYINMATLSAVCTTLFLGGYRAPWPLNYFGVIDSGWWGLLWFLLKTQLVIFFFIPRSVFPVGLLMGTLASRRPVRPCLNFLIAFIEFFRGVLIEEVIASTGSSD